MDSATLPPALRETLARFHFDQIPFDALCERLRSVRDPESLHRIEAPAAPLPVSEVVALPQDAGARAALEAEGSAAIGRGELAAVVLAGGMATRFGAVVKALAHVFDGRNETFLDLKRADIAACEQRTSGHIPSVVMTSFATHDAIRTAAAPGLFFAPQFVSLRVTREGQPFLDDAGHPSPAASGHGDLSAALRISGTLQALRARGVRHALVSNVDNLGATVDAATYALHRRSGRKISVELVRKRDGDKGGLPVVVDGRAVLAEAFRLPSDFPHDAFPLFNTNTLWIDLDVFEQDGPWTWCVARKKVDGRDAIQFERLVGELTWWHAAQWIEVPRDGTASRFVPVKDLHDLETAQHPLRALLRARVGPDL